MAESIISIFSSLDDPRMDRTKKYPLIEIIFLTISAIISGANHFTEIELFGEENIDWLKKYLDFKEGIPSHDTIGRVFELIDPKSFKDKFISWVESIHTLKTGEIIAIDGKTLRRSFDKKSGKRAIHMVSAWACESGLVLGQIKTKEKSNEITAIPELLDLLTLKGCIVTIDAMGCQKKIAESIVDRKADYVLTLKGNQGSLHENIELYFHKQFKTYEHEKYDYLKTTTESHGRADIREYWIIKPLDYMKKRGWKNLQGIGVSRLTSKTGDEEHIETRYFLTSLTLDAKIFSKAVRKHWSIENSFHWCLDIGFREDELRVRKGDAPDNFAVIRHICMNLLKQEKTLKQGLHAKRIKAAWSREYREKVLFG